MKLGDKQDKTVSTAVPDATLGTSRIANLIPEDDSGSNNLELLGSIYRLVMQSITYEMQQDDEEHKKLKDLEDEESNRNRELIKALTGRSKKKVKSDVGVIESKPKTIPKFTEPPLTAATTTATPVATGVGTAATAVAVGAGAVLGTLSLSLKAKISGRESAGMTEKSYNIMNKASGEKESNVVIKGNTDISGNSYEKNLTDMNIGEVIQLSEVRGKKINKKGAGKAAGKYQFMPGTLADMARLTFGENWQSVQYSPENQEKLMDTFVMGNAEKLQKAGLPVSDASLYMMHFFGNTKMTAIVLNDDNNNMKMADVLGPTGTTANPTVAKMTVGEYKASLRKSTTNKKGEVTKPGFTFESMDIKTGNIIDDRSTQNAEALKQLKKKSNPTIMNNTTINENQSSNGSELNISVDDRPIIIKKAE